MGNKKQQTSFTDAHTGQIIPEGYLVLKTSAGNLLNFSGPAERFSYQNNPANAAQLGKSRGEATNLN